MLTEMLSHILWVLNTSVEPTATPRSDTSSVRKLAKGRRPSGTLKPLDAALTGAPRLRHQCLMSLWHLICFSRARAHPDPKRFKHGHPPECRSREHDGGTPLKAWLVERGSARAEAGRESFQVRGH